MTNMRADQLLDLSGRVRRLLPDRRDPEAFHVERSEIAHELARLSRQAGHVPVPERAVRTVIQRVVVQEVHTVVLRASLLHRPRLPMPPRRSRGQGELPL